MGETYTLLIWEMLPEEVSMYVIPNSVIDEEKREILNKSHKKIINCDDDTENTNILSSMIAESKEYADPSIDEKLLTIWGQYEEECSKPLDKVITNVYWSGFYM